MVVVFIYAAYKLCILPYNIYIHTYIHTYIHIYIQNKKNEQVNWPVKKRKETGPYHGDTYFKTAAFCNLHEGWWCILI